MLITIAQQETAFLMRDDKSFSFINPFSLSQIFKDRSLSGDIVFGVDGGLLAMMLSVIVGQKIKRISFDFTSIARDVFRIANENQLRMAFVGGTDEEVKRFASKIAANYPDLSIACLSDGYYPDVREDYIVREVIANQCDILVCSLGAVKQERFITRVRNLGFQGYAYTCGGFFRQYASTSNDNYYPDLVNRLNLRFAYRMYKEPHTIKRYLIGYPVALVEILFWILTGKMKVELKR